MKSLNNLRGPLNFIIEVVRMAALALVIVLPIRYFLFQPFIVSGNSMSPNLEDRDYLIIDELSYRFREPQRGEVIVFYAPPNLSSRYIKRIIGLPGEEIALGQGQISIFKDGQDMILNEEEYLLKRGAKEEEASIVLKDDEYFVLGDNRDFSSDSRTWGALKREHVVGRAVLRLLPINHIQKFNAPLYSLFQQSLKLTLIENYD